MQWLNDVVNWYNSLSNEIKIIAGITLFVTAIILTILSGGSLTPLFIGMAFSIGISVVIGGISSAINGTDFWQGLADGIADGIFWGGLFAFLTASVQAIKYATGSKSFYTIQSADDYARLKAGGEPWPKGDSRALLGEGFYGWGSKADAKAYLNFKQNIRGVKDLKIYKFRIKNVNLAKLKTINLYTAGDEIANALLENISRGIPNGYQHIIRQTGNFGFEYFFDKSIIGLLRF